MPEPGMGSRGSRSGSGMGGGGGYAGPELDWGMGPEGSEGTEVGGSRPGEDRDFDDVSPLAKKAAFMATAKPVSKPVAKPVSTPPVVTPVSNVSHYLEDTTPTPLQDKQTFMSSNPSGHPSSFGILSATTKSPDQPTNVPKSWSDVAKTDIEAKKHAPRSAPVPTTGQSALLSKLSESGVKLSPEVIRALSQAQFGSLNPKLTLADTVVSDEVIADLAKKLGTSVGALYNPNKDQLGFPEKFSVTSALHELGHRDLQTQQYNSVIDQINMPNVQALYETGGNPFSAGYGSQGEMVTSRAATAGNLYETMNQFSGMPEDWVDTVLNSPNQFKTSRPLSHAAIKAGWSKNTELGPSSQEMAISETANPPFQDPAWEDNPNFQEPHKIYSGVNVAHPTHSVPGSGNWAAGYQEFLDKQQELPGKFVGGEYTPSDWYTMSGDWAPEDLQTYNKIVAKDLGLMPIGLRNHPLKQEHGLIQEFVIRNKHLIGKNSFDSTRLEDLNKVLAQKASPSSKIHQIEKLGLANEFWEKIKTYYSEENPIYDPNAGQSFIENYLSNIPEGGD